MAFMMPSIPFKYAVERPEYPLKITVFKNSHYP